MVKKKIKVKIPAPCRTSRVGVGALFWPYRPSVPSGRSLLYIPVTLPSILLVPP